MNPKRWQKIYHIMTGTSIFLLLIALFMKRDIFVATFSIAGLIIYFTALLSAFIFWRCPGCRTLLPLRGMLGMDYCPYCSCNLDDTD